MKQAHRVLWLMACLMMPLQAAPLSVDEVPGPLEPWVDWVLHEVPDRDCPFLYNNHDQRRCAWPTSLALELDNDGGRFRQRWQVYQDSFLALPGDSKHWPQAVTVNDRSAVVQARDGRPMLYLAPGDYTVVGRFEWPQLPEALQVPADTGLLELAVNGQAIAFPDLNPQGQLWLREQDVGRKQQGEDDTLTMQVYRNVRDQIPLQVTTQIQLDVSGSQREVVLGKAILPDHIPWSIDSPLPARLESDGQLRMQIRPGHWTVNVTSRAPQQVSALSMPPQDAPWPETEIWVFTANTANRLVEVTGVPGVDPRQTKLPSGWQDLPAYRLSAGETMGLKVIRRGDPDPEPDRLSLQRQLWLDFDGDGYSVQDRINGTMTQHWRLEAQPALQLGRVVINGQPQFITSLPDSPAQGVEVRRGQLQLAADSRIEGDVSRIPAVGWQQDFQSVNTTVHLPPGWSVIHAGGADNVPGTWLNRWTLLDIFMVLILSIAVMRMWDWRYGLLALATLILTWHQPYAPQYIWAHLLIAIALLRVLKSGRFHTIVTWYRNLTLLALVLVVVPFMISQVRVGIFPQLEQAWRGTGPFAQTAHFSGGSSGMGMFAQEERTMDAASEPAPTTSRMRSLKNKRDVSSWSPDSYSKAENLARVDPGATIQTGPGLPVWQWRRFELRWNGPVQSDQQVNLVLQSPAATLLLNFLRAGLMAALALVMLLTLRPRGPGRPPAGTARTTATSLFAVALLAGLFAMPAEEVSAREAGISNAGQAVIANDLAGKDLPGKDLLDELKRRLLAPPECLPGCAQISRMQLSVSPAQLQMRLQVHTAEAVAVPLPASAGQWLPRQVTIDGRRAGDLSRDGRGGLWLKLPPGVHQVNLSGPLPQRNEFQLPLPLTPMQGNVSAEGWQVEGIHEDGRMEGQLSFIRRKDNQHAAGESLDPGNLPPFVRVERVLQLGLDWRVTTRVIRATPPGSPVVLEVPLLEGESLLSEDVRTKDGHVLVSMGGQERVFQWQSVLPISSRIELSAPDTPHWVENWKVDISPIWHMTYSGIPVVHHTSREGNWLPQWLPWPGEQLTLNITRPEGIAGRTLTIDGSQVQVQPGKRATNVQLQLVLRSSQGGQHTVTLPDNALLESVTIDDKAQPIRQENNTVTLPLVPGTQKVVLDWREDTGITLLQRSPSVDIGMTSVNSGINIEVARDRWVLFTGGPLMGPAVLFWGGLLVVVLIALGLGRLHLTPLKTWHWLLLGIGLVPVNIYMAIIIVGWLLLLGLRCKSELLPERRWVFNTGQVLLGLLTIVSLSVLFYAIQQGLLGLPDMQVAGNQSTAYDLKWYQDRSGAALPRAWVLSVPLLVYRLAMLLWALWLAFALLRWLRWGWQCFTVDGIWREPVKQQENVPASGQTKDPGE